MMRNGMDEELEREDDAQFIVKSKVHVSHRFESKLAETL
jgi:hypothetical protein